MKQSLSNRNAQRLLGALRALDADEAVKLSGRTRIDVAININALMPSVQAYERANSRSMMDFIGEPKNEGDRDKNRKLAGELEQLGDDETEFDLRSIELEALRLEDNARIPGDRIAALAPILTGLGDDQPAIARPQKPGKGK